MKLEARADVLRQQVVHVCHILVQAKLDSGPFGNVSVRVPGSSETWQNPAGVSFDQLRVSDILRVDQEGKVVEGTHKPHPGEFIHREIYRLRPDVQAIVHTHSPDTVLVSLLGRPIEPFTQLGAAIFEDQGVYQGFSGPVRDSNEGRAIAEALGQRSFVIAKNHGLFATGLNLAAATWDMIVADQAAKVHLGAWNLGLREAGPLTPESLEKSRREVRELQYPSVWENQIAKLRETRPDLF